MKHKSKSRPTRLQQDLLPQILELVRGDGLGPGARLTEVEVAERLQVSRTPVRAALQHLARRGLVEARPRRGFVLRKSAASLTLDDAPAASDETNELCVEIARDRLAGRLPLEVSESDLMRRYQVTRPFLLKVLNQLAGVALIERKPGRGWLFSQAMGDSKARAESYAFCRLLEPAAILTPGFHLDPAWIAEMRERHRAVLAAPWRKASSVGFFEMNAAFHLGIAAGADNRYLLLALEQQTRLRRLVNYDWTFGHERVVTSCNEHLAMLDWIERGELEVAAALMRSHIDAASRLPHPQRDREDAS
ncbi:GntR family transcriptional regulator [Bradyrhizobium sp. LTSP885]|uniref:GntR family transcriptional regulator n=1 Tax=Bradyrhizobium sp. LTSP885 TaxID=1619232 RepID=UPI0005CAC01E|nr:GntR family transcriptional regulator [Bradyrhizobium sp. LTSP885]KJC51253.1 GntR family transcriptional regulator [Bradyrhizobium sp. LTSP885]